VSRTEFFAGLLEHGTKLREDYPDVVEIYHRGENIYDRHFPAAEDGLNLIAPPTAEEEIQVAQLVSVVSPDNAVFDPSILWAIGSFAAKHPEFVTFVWSLIKRKKA
jgi:hypothetical protein